MGAETDCSFLLLAERGSSINHHSMPLTDGLVPILDVLLYERHSTYSSRLSLQSPVIQQQTNTTAPQSLLTPSDTAATTNQLVRMASSPEGALKGLTLKSNFSRE